MLTVQPETLESEYGLLPSVARSYLKAAVPAFAHKPVIDVEVGQVGTAIT